MISDSFDSTVDWVKMLQKKELEMNKKKINWSSRSRVKY